MTRLSVVVVSYNVKHFLEQALHSVFKALKGIESEVFVVDNNSVDGSAYMVRQKFPQVKLIESKINLGFSKGNNLAIRQAKGEYILLLNPDTVVEEESFRKLLDFMDKHPEAGASGVKMLDGRGRFLPESKRGLPSPSVAFFKISGLSTLFPKSRIFGKYHLKYLDENKVHEVEVLSGAFFLVRKKVLDEIGLLDEDFFMYGEDIDLSYRILKAGYKNYYFPDTHIIHYKGESTKKDSINYVIVFYKAMAIFAKKHFSGRNAGLFNLLINFGIYLRAFASIVIRIIKKASLPALDFLVLFSGLVFLSDFWGNEIKTHVVKYPEKFIWNVLPAYVIAWISSVFISGGYDKPFKPGKLNRGILSGTVLILVIYALLPESMRFSRAVILLGTIWGLISLNLGRFILSFFLPAYFGSEKNHVKRILVAGEKEEAQRVIQLLKQTIAQFNVIGIVSPDDNFDADDYVGSIEQMDRLVQLYQIDEVIFCAANIPSQAIIGIMGKLSKTSVDYKIAPPESLYIIGSNSIHSNGELYVIDINSVSKPSNARNKRVMDIALAFSLFLLSPFTMWFVKNKGGYLRNILMVAGGRKTWVGYALSHSGNGIEELPKLRKGVLSPLSAVGYPSIDKQTVSKLNGLYAKDYTIYNDLFIIAKAFRDLGN